MASLALVCALDAITAAALAFGVSLAFLALREVARGFVSEFVTVTPPRFRDSHESPIS